MKMKASQTGMAELRLIGGKVIHAQVLGSPCRRMVSSATIKKLNAFEHKPICWLDRDFRLLLLHGS